jgi:hypothetical protein
VIIQEMRIGTATTEADARAATTNRFHVPNGISSITIEVMATNKVDTDNSPVVIQLIKVIVE